MTTTTIEQQKLNQVLINNIVIEDVENTADIELDLEQMLMSNTPSASSGANRKWEFPSEVNAYF